jgi:hypothetical protein
MPRLKRSSSKVLRLAATRAAGMKTIDAALDLGNGLTLAAYHTAIADTQAKQSAYNGLLAQSDEARNVFSAAEGSLADLTDRMLAGVAGKYGRDSDEYVKAGGTKKSQRKRRGYSVLTVNAAAQKTAA